MRIAFVSSILNHAWGGADALWTSAAERSLARGDHVLVAVTAFVAAHPRVAALVRSGAGLQVRPRSDLAVPFTDRVGRRLRRALGRPDPLVARLRRFAPDLVVFSGGGTYDPILEQPVHDWLAASGTPFRVIANFQNEHPQLSEADRVRVRGLLAAAERIFFVSPRNLAITRRHLVHDLPRAECIHGVMVHNAMPSAPTPWPAGGPFRFATVSRLEAVKGLDLFLHALAAALAGESGWTCHLYGRGQQHAYLVECARALGLADRVTVHGFVDSLDAVRRKRRQLFSRVQRDRLIATLRK